MVLMGGIGGGCVGGGIGGSGGDGGCGVDGVDGGVCVGGGGSIDVSGVYQVSPVQCNESPRS